MEIVLNEILYDLLERQEEIEKELKILSNKIREEEYYLDICISNKKENDFFYPREKESLNKDEIEERKERKSLFEKQYHEYQSKSDKICEQTKKLKVLIKDRDKRDTTSLRGTSDEEVAFARNSKELEILDIQEEERQRIARDLHDITLQDLTHIIHKIELANMYIDKEPINAKLELASINKKLRENIEEIRNIVLNLRPMTFDDLGFQEALMKMLEDMNKDKKYHISCEIHDVSCENQLVMITIYRIIKECLTNIEKHSHAKNIMFKYTRVNDVIEIVIEDDGRGFDYTIITKEDKKFGISIMKERVNLLGGNILIQSKVDRGTKLFIRIPIS